MSAIIEVIVGIVFVYILLSILVTEINTIISNTFRLRARNLRQALDKIIADPVMRAKIYSHPLIQLVEEQTILPGQRISVEDARKVAEGAISAVDWIDSNTFVDVLLSTIKVDADQELFGALLNVVDGMPSGPERRTLRVLINRVVSSGEGMDELREAIAHVDTASVRNALTDTLEVIDDEISEMGLEPNSIVSIMAGLRQVNNPYFRNALSTILATAETLEEAQGKIAQWFNDSMGRASSTFTVKMKTLSIIVALVISLLANIDSLHLARTLWEDPILRESLSTAARSAAESGALQQSINDANQANSDAMSGISGTDDVIEDIRISMEAAQETVNSINELRLPLGWTYQDLNADNVSADSPLRSVSTNFWNFLPWNNSGWLGQLLAKLLGIAGTVIAISQGAPFWFNILNKIISRN